MENALAARDQMGEALLDGSFGKSKREELLRFELPPSMDAGCNQKEDVPYDYRDPGISLYLA